MLMGFLQNHMGQVEVVLSLGTVMASFLEAPAIFFPSAYDPENMELQACSRAILLAQELNVQRLILESDSKEAVRKIQSGQRDLSANGQVLQEI